MKFKVVHVYSYSHESVVQEFESKVEERVKEGYEPWGDIQPNYADSVFSLSLLMFKKNSK